MKTVTNLGEAITALREERGWSQAALAAAANVSERTVQRLEEGQPGTIETVGAIARAFGLDVEGLQHMRDFVSLLNRAHLIPAIRTAPALLTLARGAEACALHIESEDPTLRDAAHALAASVRHWNDLSDEPDFLPDAERDLGQLIQVLEESGGRLFCYRHPSESQFKLSGEPILLDTLFCVVYPRTFRGIHVGDDGREMLFTVRQPEDQQPVRT